MVNCSACNVPIEPVQFQKGEAVTILDKNYCPSCTTRAIRRSKSADFLPDNRTPRPFDPRDLLRPPDAE